MQARKLLNNKRTRRAHRVRAQVAGTGERPRLSVFRSNRFIWAQLIDDEKGSTIAAASTRGMKAETAKTKMAQAARLGADLAKRALEKSVKAAVLDRGQYRYHGRIKALADGAREAGLKI